ncbi:gag-pol polyprotein [Tanacetum coccineum]
MEMWTGKPFNYSDIHIFGSIVYVMYNTQETMKLDPKFRKRFFVRYAYEAKGYHLGDPTAQKVVVSRVVVFMEDKIHDNQENDRTTKETTSIHMENHFNRMILLKLHLSTSLCYGEQRRILSFTEEGESSTLQEALNNPDASPWMVAMQEDIEALHKNKT